MESTMSNGRRYNIWPMVTIPVDRVPTEVRLDGRYGIAWLQSLAETPEQLTEHDRETITHALGEFPFLDPNSLNDYKLIAPLAKLGLLAERSIDRIIDEAVIDFNPHTKDIVRKNAPDGPDSIPVEKRSPGLVVLDELDATGVLTSAQVSKIIHRKADYVVSIADSFQRSIFPR